MLEFTLDYYARFLRSLVKQFAPSNIVTMAQYIEKPQAFPRFCILRHDVDRKPLNSLKVSRLEAEHGLKATYYFRTKSHTFKPEIIEEIQKLGHEIGYHYESLSDTDGDIEKSLIDFERNLNRLRQYAEVKTCSMHGRPLKKFDNRDMWKHGDNLKLLQSRFALLGEAYLNVDYTDIAYITDTGRNWSSHRNNIRDRVESKYTFDFQSSDELALFLEKQTPDKMVFQTHPERWTNDKVEWVSQLAKDQLINIAKSAYNNLLVSRG